MSKFWKISHTGKINEPVKVTLRVEVTKTIAISIEPGKFALCLPYITAQLDAQQRKKLLIIEQSFDNSYLNLEVGKQYETSTIEELQKKAVEFTGSEGK